MRMSPLLNASMIQSFRRPLASAAGLSSPIERRCFSQIHPRWAAKGFSKEGGGMLTPKQQADRSIRLLNKEQMVMPSDIGLLPGTFVTPMRSPPLIPTPRHFFNFQWMRVKTRARDLLSLLILKITSPRGKRWYSRSLKLHRSQTVPTAVAFHREMYNALADGDLPTLRKICTDGIYERFQARIGARKRGEKMHWELVQYNKAARVISHKGARLPIEGAAIRQAVVRICSTQRLTRYGPNGQVIEGTGEERKVVEYVVIQKSYRDWRGKDWQIWGTTKETTLAEAQEWERKSLAA